MNKYEIIISVETEKSPEELTKPCWGALLIDAGANWKVLSTERVSA